MKQPATSKFFSFYGIARLWLAVYLFSILVPYSSTLAQVQDGSGSLLPTVQEASQPMSPTPETGSGAVLTGSGATIEDLGEVVADQVSDIANSVFTDETASAIQQIIFHAKNSQCLGYQEMLQVLSAHQSDLSPALQQELESLQRRSDHPLVDLLGEKLVNSPKAADLLQSEAQGKVEELTRSGSDQDSFNSQVTKQDFQATTAFEDNTDTLSQTVELQDGSQTKGFQSTLQGVSGLCSSDYKSVLGDTKVYIGSSDVFTYTQKVNADGKVELKEFIYSFTPQTDTGSSFTWGYKSLNGQDKITLEKNSDGTVSIYAVPLVSGLDPEDDAAQAHIRSLVEQTLGAAPEKKLLATITPLVYVTATGKQKTASYAVNNNLLTVNLHESADSYPLLIDPSYVFHQWLGGTSNDSVLAIATDGSNTVYAAGNSGSASSWESVPFSGTHSGGQEAFVVKIQDGGTPTPLWGQWLGGTGDDTANALTVNGSTLYVTGYSTSDTSWETVSFSGSYSGGAEAFVVKLQDGASPSLTWGQWLGGTGDDYANALVANATDLYVGGYSTSLTSWEGLAFSGSFLGAASDAFVIKLQDAGASPTSVWGQWLGGVGTDIVYGLSWDGTDLYAGGTSGSSAGWETVTFAGSFDGSIEGFVLKIQDGVTPTLLWGQWLGGVGTSAVTSLLSTGGVIYVGGYSTGPTTWELSSCGSEPCFSGTYSGGQEGIVIKIQDGVTPSLLWGQWLGSTGTDIVTSISRYGTNIYAAGHSANDSAWETVPFTGTHSTGSDGFVVEIADAATPTLNWGQWLGGTGTDVVNTVATVVNLVYVGGYSTASTSWAPTAFGGAYSGADEAFLGKISNGADITSPVVSVNNVDGDVTAPYYDNTDDSATSLVLSVADTDSGVLNCRYATTNIGYTAMTNDCAAPAAGTSACALGNLPAGSYTYYYSCVDNASNFSNTQSVVFGVDVTAANITVTAPANGGTTQSSFAITATTDENANCSYNLDAAGFVAMSTTGTTSHSHTLSGLSFASHTLQVRCIDPANNIATSPVITWTVVDSGGGGGGGGGGYIPPPLGNQNANSNTNGNMNTNTNGNSNQNATANQNSNANQNGNSNTNAANQNTNGSPSITVLKFATYPVGATNSHDIELQTVASGATVMCFWGDLDTPSVPLCFPYGNSTALTLTAGDGTKGIYGQFSNPTTGDASGIVSTSILVDSTPPTPPVFEIPATTKARAIVLNLQEYDDATEVFISGGINDTTTTNQWVAVQSSYDITLKTGIGNKIVRVKSRDAAGNESEVTSHNTEYAPDQENTNVNGTNNNTNTQPALNNNQNGVLTNDNGNAGVAFNQNENSAELNWNLNFNPPSPDNLDSPESILLKTDLLQQDPCLKDSDSDGLSDCQELKLGTDPNQRDSDGDGFSDGDESLLYGTNPLDAKDNQTVNDLLRITNWKDGDIMSASDWLFLGTCKVDAGLTVQVFLADATTHQETSLGSTGCRPEKLFSLGVSQEFPDGYYALIAREYNQDGVKQRETKPIAIVVDKTKALAVPKPEAIDNVSIKDLTPPFLTAHIVVENQRPTVIGKTVYGADVRAVFESIITSSTITADTVSGDFAITAANPLELGDHKVTLYALSPDGMRSGTVTIPFIIQPAVGGGSVMNNPWVVSLLVVVLLALLGGGTFWYLRRSAKKAKKLQADKLAQTNQTASDKVLADNQPMKNVTLKTPTPSTTPSVPPITPATPATPVVPPASSPVSPASSPTVEVKPQPNPEPPKDGGTPPMTII